MTNLCCITAYSFAKSSVDVDSYVGKAKELGYDAVGICDENVTYAFPLFFDSCKKHGIKGVAGISIHISYLESSFEILVYALNEDGYLGICKLLSKNKQIYSIEDFEGNDGLCIILKTKDGSFDLLSKIANELGSIFSNFYFGITIDGKDDKPFAKKMIEFASSHSYECVALPTVRYLESGDAFVVDIIRSSKENRELTTEERRHEDKMGPEHLLDKDELNSTYGKDLLENADRIASLANFDLFSRQRGGLFSFTGDEKGDIELFERKIEDSMSSMGLMGNPKYEERLRFEKETIFKMGFASYFLIVSDYVSYAKGVGIKVGPGRGSAAGSLVSYLLGITQIDPLSFGLSFERFLNPYRVTMPDIDIDFQDDRRDEIVEYLKRKYGQGRVAKIVTFGTYKARSAVRASGVALGIPQSRLSLLTKSIPNNAESLKDAYKKSDELKRLCNDPYFLRIMKYARKLEGLPNNTSMHAAGVIVAKDDIFDSVPMSEGESGVASYEYQYLERMGFLKVDLLSLRYLTIISRIEKKIESEGRKIPDYLSLIGDKDTYETICSLDLTLIFQLDSNIGMRNATKEISPSTFDDLVALLALYRPGPMDNIPLYSERKKTGRIPSSGYDNVDRILRDTYGILVYQEQILRLAHDIAGMDMGEADMLRRAISKKHAEQIEAYRQKFIDGCKANGVIERDAISIYALILKFANYGFNKSHSVCYALITFELAYLKTHEPKAFFREAMKEISPGSERFRTVALELNHRKITLSPIDPNISTKDEIFINDRCYLGLGRIKSLSDKNIEMILGARQERPFDGIGDFLLRGLDFAFLDNRTLGAMIDSGLFDTFGYDRMTLRENIPDIMQFMQSALDGSQFPILRKVNATNLDRRKAFVKELDRVGISLSISLRKMIGTKYKKGYSIGIATEDFQPNPHGGMITLANEYSKVLFLVDGKPSIKAYDLVIFKARKARYPKDRWFAEDVTIVESD